MRQRGESGKVGRTIPLRAVRLFRYEWIRQWVGTVPKDFQVAAKLSSTPVWNPRLQSMLHWIYCPPLPRPVDDFHPALPATTAATTPPFRCSRPRAATRDAPGSVISNLRLEVSPASCYQGDYFFIFYAPPTAASYHLVLPPPPAPSVSSFYPGRSWSLPECFCHTLSPSGRRSSRFFPAETRLPVVNPTLEERGNPRLPPSRDESLIGIDPGMRGRRRCDTSALWNSLLWRREGVRKLGSILQVMLFLAPGVGWTKCWDKVSRADEQCCLRAKSW